MTSGGVDTSGPARGSLVSRDQPVPSTTPGVVANQGFDYAQFRSQLGQESFASWQQQFMADRAAENAQIAQQMQAQNAGVAGAAASLLGIGVAAVVSQAQAIQASVYGQRVDPSQQMLNLLPIGLGAVGAGVGMLAGPWGGVLGAGVGGAVGSALDATIRPHMELAHRRAVVGQIYGQSAGAMSMGALQYLEGAAANPMGLSPALASAVDPYFASGRQKDGIEALEKLLSGPAAVRLFGDRGPEGTAAQDLIRAAIRAGQTDDPQSAMAVARNAQEKLGELEARREWLKGVPRLFPSEPVWDFGQGRIINPIEELAEVERQIKGQEFVLQGIDIPGIRRNYARGVLFGSEMTRLGARQGVENERAGYSRTYGNLDETMASMRRSVNLSRAQLGEINERIADMMLMGGDSEQLAALMASEESLLLKIRQEETDIMETGLELRTDGFRFGFESRRMRGHRMDGSELRAMAQDQRRVAAHFGTDTARGRQAEMEALRLDREEYDLQMSQRRADLGLGLAGVSSDSAFGSVVGTAEERVGSRFGGQLTQMGMQRDFASMQLRQMQQRGLGTYEERAGLQAQIVQLEGQIRAIAEAMSVQMAQARIGEVSMEAGIFGAMFQRMAISGMTPGQFRDGALGAAGMQGQVVRQIEQEIQALRARGRTDNDSDMQALRMQLESAQMNELQAQIRSAQLYRSPMTQVASERRAFTMRAGRAGYLGQHDSRQAALAEMEQISRERQEHAQTRERLKSDGRWDEATAAAWERSQLELDQRELAARTEYDEGWMDRLISQSFNSGARGRQVIGAMFTRLEAAGASPAEIRSFGTLGPARNPMGPARFLSQPGGSSPQGFLEGGLRQHELVVVIKDTQGNVLGRGTKALDGQSSTMQLSRPSEFGTQGRQG
jgi:hypothetical protein